MLKRWLVAAGTAATVFVLPSTVRAETPFWKCLPSNAIVPMARTIANTSSPAALAGVIAPATFRLQSSGTAFTLSSAVLPQPLNSRVSSGADPCQALPEHLALGPDTTIPGRNIADLAAVLAFKKTYRWPVSPANLDAPDAYVILRTYDDRHDIVTLRSAFGHRDARGRSTTLGCGSEEFYRVDAGTLRVLPFEGCIEGGGRHIPGLPHFGNLPP